MGTPFFLRYKKGQSSVAKETSVVSFSEGGMAMRLK